LRWLRGLQLLSVRSLTPWPSVALFRNGVRESLIRFEDFFLNACSASALT
jgi:hypothetical protein